MRFANLVLVVAAVVALAVPGVALAGGWSVVSLDSHPEGIVQGQEFTIGFTVLQHGRTPLAGLKPVVKLFRPASGERLDVTAIDDGPTGHYLARPSFPREGTWEWSINAFEGDHPMPPLTVKPATGSSVAPVPSAAVRSGNPAGQAWAPAVVAAALAALSISGLVYVARRERLGVAGGAHIFRERRA